MKYIQITLVAFSALTWLIASPSMAHSNESSSHRTYPKDSGAETEPGKVVTQFHKAIKRGLDFPDFTRQFLVQKNTLPQI